MASSNLTLLKIFQFLMCCFCVLTADLPTPDLCQDPSIEAATSTQDGRTYFFKGDYYWKVKGVESTGIARGYPRKISEDWGGLPGNLDAAFISKDGNTFFFKYWSFRNKKMDFGYPKEISDGFEGIPDSIDAAVVWSVDWKTYFFKGSNYWIYPSDGNSSYPQPISNFEGMPSDIDAALHFVNHHTYFFKGRSYYRSDERLTAVSTHDPALPYPRSNSVWWFGCQTQTHVESSEKPDVDPQQNESSDKTTPCSENEGVKATSATFSDASLFLTLLLVFILQSHRRWWIGTNA